MQSEIITKLKSRTKITDREILVCIEKHLKERNRPNAWIEVDIVGKKKMKSLNKVSLSHDYATDVLSFPVAAFPSAENYDFIGTVVLCNDIIHRQAKILGKTFENEFLFCLRHGIDHLLGIHHN